MTDSTNRNRKPAGSPHSSGGQFTRSWSAETSRGLADDLLSRKNVDEAIANGDLPADFDVLMPGAKLRAALNLFQARERND